MTPQTLRTHPYTVGDAARRRRSYRLAAWLRRVLA